MPLRRRIGLLILALAAAAGCLALGWWQWTRYESTSGTFQNLGYALQWPMFAGFCVYAYRRFLSYEQSPPAEPDAAGEIPAGLLPDRPPAEKPATNRVLNEYNAYLAELAENDKRTTP